MSIQRVLFTVVLLYAQQTFTRYTHVNVSLNLSATLTDENSQLSEEMVRICMKETQLSMAELEKLKTNEIAESEVNESTQCFVHCLYEHMGVTKNGIFLDNDDAQRLAMDGSENGDFAVCRSIHGNNKCETAYKIHQCIQKVKYGGARDLSHSTTADANSNNQSAGDDDESTDNQNGQ